MMRRVRLLEARAGALLPMAVVLALAAAPLLAQYEVGPDFSVGVSRVGQVTRVALPNGHIARPTGPGYPVRSQYYKGAAFWHYVDLMVGVPEGPWTPRVFDPDLGDTVGLGPAVAEGISAYAHAGPLLGPDWGPCPGSRGKYFSGEVLAGHLWPDSEEPDVAVMATSTLPETWPYDLYGFRRWPGAWARDPETGKPGPGLFASDEELFFAFTDAPYANRTYLGATSYPIGAKVECQVRAFADSYANAATFYELDLINAAAHHYSGVYVGLFSEVRFGLYTCRWELVDCIRRGSPSPEGGAYPYDMGYWYKTPEGAARIRELVGNPHLVLPFMGVLLLETPLAPFGDGVDNDGDGQVDEAEGEQLGLTGWHLCHAEHSEPHGPWVNYLARKDRDLWMYKVLSGDTTGLEEELKEEFFIPDPTGRLDPHFDSPTGIAALYPELLVPATFLMSTGPFDWASGDTVHLA
ncbi:MAG: hypothetical protein ACUVTG_10740, partial [Candidatus Oleimicrobiaceae bacterium]